MALSETASTRSHAVREARGRVGHPALTELEVSLFSVNRQGTVLWSTAAAQRDLAQLRALADAEAGQPPHLSAAWARRLWAQVQEGSGDRQMRLLMPGLLPCAGMLMWHPARKDRLSVVLWSQAHGSTWVDPLWQGILTKIGDAGAPCREDRAA